MHVEARPSWPQERPAHRRAQETQATPLCRLLGAIRPAHARVKGESEQSPDGLARASAAGNPMAQPAPGPPWPLGLPRTLAAPRRPTPREPPFTAGRAAPIALRPSTPTIAPQERGPASRGAIAAVTENVIAPSCAATATPMRVTRLPEAVMRNTHWTVAPPVGCSMSSSRISLKRLAYVFARWSYEVLVSGLPRESDRLMTWTNLPAFRRLSMVMR